MNSAVVAEQEVADDGARWHRYGLLARRRGLPEKLTQG
jgi:hypothetical protein